VQVKIDPLGMQVAQDLDQMLERSTSTANPAI
jgi:hypothetical protein